MSVATTEGLAQTNSGDIGGYTQRQDSNASNIRAPRQPEFIFIAPVIVPEQKKPDPGPYKPNCDEPQSAEDGNFCQARRSAKAAEDAARAGEDAAIIARDQLWLGWLGFGGLILTVVFAAWAAIAASRAAKSAAKSTEIADGTLKEFRKNSEIELRAYIVVNSPKLLNFETAKDARLSIKFINKGQTPAYNMQAHVQVRAHSGSIPADFFGASQPPETSRGILGPSQKCLIDTKLGSQMTDAKIASINAKTIALFVFGYVNYRDIYNVDRVTKFRFEFIGENDFATCFDGNEAT